MAKELDKQPPPSASSKRKTPLEVEEEPTSKKTCKFIAFTGSSRRLGDEPSSKLFNRDCGFGSSRIDDHVDYCSELLSRCSLRDSQNFHNSTFIAELDLKPRASTSSKSKISTKVEAELTSNTPIFIPFTGFARRLDGEPTTKLVEQTPSSIMLKRQQHINNETKRSNSKPSGTASCRTPGKLVFRSNANTHKIKTQPLDSQISTSKDLLKKIEEQKFQAFTGKKYSLMS
ncbi:hypothetical protein RIF29_29144 [Crotalaria pallida]|uniref:Uncharacterized protein n=1 Tax=Crotalaria pallida TaxID=3830 RepID=A0AAN9EG65_CROPI